MQSTFEGDNNVLMQQVVPSILFCSNCNLFVDMKCQQLKKFLTEKKKHGNCNLRCGVCTTGLLAIHYYMSFQFQVCSLLKLIAYFIFTQIELVIA